MSRGVMPRMGSRVCSRVVVVMAMGDVEDQQTGKQVAGGVIAGAIKHNGRAFDVDGQRVWLLRVGVLVVVVVVVVALGVGVCGGVGDGVKRRRGAAKKTRMGFCDLGKKRHLSGSTWAKM